MATRTKSFFDQDPKAKPRPAQWQRGNNTNGLLSELDRNAAPPKPPIPATSQSKSKVRAFQFAPDPGNADKENEDATVSTSVQPGLPSQSGPAEAQPSALKPSQETSDKKTPSLLHANTFPSTPAARLSLVDLIGDVDDARRQEPTDDSPEERIGWIPNSSSTLLTPNRRRKRARSSSPSCPATSSQRQEASNFFAGKDPQDTETPSIDLDPAADLWRRYASRQESGEKSRRTDFDRLMFQASPRPLLETPAKNAGFRRWASTGNDWPSSKNKRRRTEMDVSIQLSRQQEQNHSGKSKVANMVERIQESLATQRLEQAQKRSTTRPAAPSSSSPLPEIGYTTGVTGAVSPLQHRRPESKKQSQATSRPSQSLQPNYDVEQQIPHSDQPSHPETDGEHLQQAQPKDEFSNPTRLHLQSRAPMPAFKRPSISRAPSNQMRPAPPTSGMDPPLETVTEEFDEFGDDMDFSVEDLEELMSQPPPPKALYDIAEHPNPPASVPSVVLQQGGVSPGLAQHVPEPNHHGAQAVSNGDEFGDDDIDEDSFAQAEISATQAFRPLPPTSNDPPSKPSFAQRRNSCRNSQISGELGAQLGPVIDTQDVHPELNRFIVEQMIRGEFTNDKGRSCPEIVLLAHSQRTRRTTAITLRGSWTDVAVSIGNIVHITTLPSRRQPTETAPLGQVLLDDSENSPILILHPDHMLSATTVSDSFDCLRKAVFSDRVKATGEASRSMVYGSILHEIFQQALSANTWTDEFLANLVQRTISTHLEGLWELGMRDTVLAVEEITAKMGELAAWARIFIAEIPSDVSLVDDKQGEKVWMSISRLVAIEEHVWSPRFGLKGNVDATVQTTLRDHPSEPAKRLIVPFEVKTGRTTQSPSHRAQTALYTLLLSDRYDAAVEAGILYYLESSSMSRIAPPFKEIRQMVQQRNRLASYLHRAKLPLQKENDQSIAPSVPLHTQEIEESGLPTLIKNPFKCGRCYAQQTCFTYHALVEHGTADSAGMQDDARKNHSMIWEEAVGHLSLRSQKEELEQLRVWFTKWDRLLTYEEGDLSRFKKELWTMPSSERESIGRCFGKLVISQSSDLQSSATVDGIQGGGGKINRFTYAFARAVGAMGPSFTEGSQLTVGEPVVVSSESGQWALANGYVIGVSKHSITVAVDRRLGNARQRAEDFDDAINQSFAGIMTVGSKAGDTRGRQHSEVLYRLDKDEFSNGLANIRRNLVNLMSSHPIHAKLRKQIVFDASPTFYSPSQLPSMPPSQLGEMNEDQQAAVGKVLSAQDYALILGMPGTGKTTTIAHVIRALLAEGKSILLTSFTHTAVDNILLKIRDIAPPNSILRLGVPAKINQQVQQFCQLAATPRHSIDEIEEAYMGSRIVATTCMGTNHALFGRRAFDVCIVDEASQITLPTSLGPLLHARKFVLVGDHYQLPPLVQNRTAQENGLDVSLFRMLSERHPHAIAKLAKQYRMCDDVMTLSNQLVYDGQLQCGNDSVARRTLQLVQPPFTAATDVSSTYVSQLVDSQRKVVFTNTDTFGPSARETLSTGKNISNHFEATLAARTVLALLSRGVPAKNIGVITLYRSQLALLRQLFKAAGIEASVEIDSADRFQGRDKECIILSMVRSNEQGIVGDLLKDWRRVNVAFTRARSKLIIVGSRRTLRNNSLLERFLQLVDQRGWVSDVPVDFEAGLPLASQSPVVVRAVEQQIQKKAATSPSKGVNRSVLAPSPSAGNRSHVKRNPKMVTGHKTGIGGAKARKVKEQVAIEIFEDMM